MLSLPTEFLPFNPKNNDENEISNSETECESLCGRGGGAILVRRLFDDLSDEYFL